MTTDIYLSKFAKTCPQGFCLRMGVAHVQARVAEKYGGACHRARCWKIYIPGPDITVGGWAATLCQK